MTNRRYVDATGVRRRRHRIVAGSVAAAGLLSACGDATGPEHPVLRVVDMRLEDVNGVLSPRDTLQLTVVLLDEAGGSAAGEIRWTSSDLLVASVSSEGLVTAHAIGDASIVATHETPFGPLGDTVAVRVMEVAFASLADGAPRCGLSAEGTAFCLGADEEGRYAPLPVPADVAFTSLTAGAGFTCALTAQGHMYCWGEDRAECAPVTGTGCTSYIVASETPVPVADGMTFASITAGLLHVCGLTPGGAAHCWGLNSSGQLGDGSRQARSNPAAVVGVHAFTSLSAGRDHTCGVTSQGAALCWGDNFFGQVGTGELDANCKGVFGLLFPCRVEPTAVVGGLSFQSVDADAARSCGLTGGGEVRCWGVRRSVERVPQPEPEQPGHVFVRVSTGGSETCAVTGGGQARCWQSRVGATIVDVGRFAHVSGAACGLTANGSMFCWDARFDPVHVRGTIMPDG